MNGARLLIGFFFILLPAIFICIGAGVAWKQHDRISNYVAVDAVVDSSKVNAHRGSKSTTYTPAIHYHYDVRGRSYASHDVLPIEVSSGQSWARAIVARFPAGSATTAYHDPGDPSRAFLVREYSFFPYMFMLFPMIHLSVGVALVFGTKWMRSAQTAQPPRLSRFASWFELQPRQSIGQKLRVWTIMSSLWFGVGLVAAGHYFMNASPPYDKLAIFGSLIYAALGMIPGGVWLYYFLLLRRTTDAIVMTGVDRFAPGQTFQVRVVQLMRDQTLIESLKVGIVCDKQIRQQSGGKTRYDTVVDYEDWSVLLENHAAHAEETIEQIASLTVPRDRPSTSVGKGYPRYQWRIAVRAALKASPDYHGEFPIHVEGGSAK